jgi:predicted dehydrogenase
MGNRIRTAVIGVGHLGQHHARNLSQLEESQLVAVVDSDMARAKMLADKWNCEAVDDYRKLLGRVDAVSVAVPTVHHYSVAKWLFENGIHALVEKPLCFRVDEAEALVELANRKGLTLQVGHIERFNPALRTIRSQLDGVAFIEAHRLSPFPFRSTDIGVIMDVMIHDLDIILSLVDSPVDEIRATATPVLSRVHEDIANARVQFENGAVANITASRISDKVARKMRMFCNAKYFNLDFAAKQAMIYSKTPKLDAPDFDVATLDVSGVDNLMQFVFNDLIKVEQVTINAEGEPLRLELKAFLDSVASGRRADVTGEDGLKAIALAHDILAASKRHTNRFRAAFEPGGSASGRSAAK